MTTVTKHQLFWPVTALLALLLVDFIVKPSFFSIEVRDGHLYGSLIDILRLGAPLILVGIGMTVVVATRGIDLSVGSVVAISGALACLHLSGMPDQDVVSGPSWRSPWHWASASCSAPGTGSSCRCWASSRSSRR